MTMSSTEVSGNSSRVVLENPKEGPAIADDPNEDDPVDEVVVDSELLPDLLNDSESLPGQNQSTTQRTQDGVSEKTESVYQRSNLSFFEFIKFVLWPMIHNFFDLSFRSPEKESMFRKEQWFNSKYLAFMASVFLIINWALYLGLTFPYDTESHIFYSAISTLVTWPLPVLVALDFPKKRYVLWQVMATIATFWWSYAQVIEMYTCNFWHPAISTCHGQTFVGSLYFVVALPIYGMLALMLNRLSLFCGFMGYLILHFALTIPIKPAFMRTLTNIICFTIFMLFVSYQKEKNERRLYTLRDELKVQYRATQKAQVNERKASNSKKRFISYIFHEVRVPLNTALLAVQNLAAEGYFPPNGNGDDSSLEFSALDGSLAQMSKVLNDVLDYNRMSSNRFDSIAKPFNFHTSIRSMLGALKVATDAKRLSLVVNLDERIDLVARDAAIAAGGSEDFAGIVVGDEMRLRQIITNLAGNSCKFTAEGGTISIRTSLVFPQPHVGPDVGDTSDYISAPESNNTTQHNDTEDSTIAVTPDIKMHPPHAKRDDLIIIRIEVQDTGVGIKRRDVHDLKLFSPYVQTEVGKKHGRSGTGLGLALVRQVVQRSGGRLGLQSQRGVGSTFWIEMPYGIGKSALTGAVSPEAKTIPLPPRLPPPPQPLTLNTDLGSMAQRPGPALRPSYISSHLSAQSTNYSTNSETPSSSLSPYELNPTNEPFAPLTSIPYNTSAQALDNIAEAAENTLAISPISPISSEAAASPIADPLIRDFGVAATTPKTRFAPRPIETSPHTRPARLAEQLPTSRAPSFISRVQAPTPDPVPLTPAFEDPKALRVMIVDDDDLTRKLMSRMVSRLAPGCQIDTAENGQDAIQKLLGTEPNTTAQRYDIIFLDNQMPIMSGVQVVAKLRKHNRDDFTIGCTGNALKEDQEEFESKGCDHVLTKPIKQGDLGSMLALASDRKKQTLDPPPLSL